VTTIQFPVVLTGGGNSAPYDDVPWFWSEIAGRKLQIAGASVGADKVVLRGDPQTARFSVFRYAGDRLVVVESVNAPADHMIGRKLVTKPYSVTPAQAQDLSFNLKAALQ
jgi:3-phenylpropionate/trans-cinnamate dioxygenase ferredoxin reductase component